MTKYTDAIDAANKKASITSDRVTDDLVTKVTVAVRKQFGRVGDNMIAHLVDAVRTGYEWDIEESTFGAGLRYARRVALADMVGDVGLLDDAGIWSKAPVYAKLVVLKAYEEYEKE